MTTFQKIIEQKTDINIDENPFFYEMTLNGIANNMAFSKRSANNYIMDKIGDLQKQLEEYQGFDFQDDKIQKQKAFIEQLENQVAGYEALHCAAKTELHDLGLNYKPAGGKKADNTSKRQTATAAEAQSLLEKYNKKPQAEADPEAETKKQKLIAEYNERLKNSA